MENFGLKIISWNINGGVDTKWKNSGISYFLCTYDIIFVCECWIDKYELEVDGFKSYIYSRMKSKSKLGYVMFYL